MYYIIEFIYLGKEYYCIWVSNDDDYVLTESNSVIKFNEINDLAEYASINNITLENNSITKYDVDKVVLWCNNLCDTTVDCYNIIDFWNICTDLSNGVKCHFIGTEEQYDTLYEKIFLGNNITNNSQKVYKPLFSNVELQSLKNIIKEGVNIIVDNLTN